MSYRGRIQSAREAILRTVAYFDTIDYASWTECATWFEWSGASGLKAFLRHRARNSSNSGTAWFRTGQSNPVSGRVASAGRLAELATRSPWSGPLFPRKLRRAAKVALAHAESNIRFVALANTTALAHARDLGDLDFFVVVRRNTIWSSRLWGRGCTSFSAGSRAAKASATRCACRISWPDGALICRVIRSPGDDPYFRYWFCRSLPLADDGVSARAVGRQPAAHRPPSARGGAGSRRQTKPFAVHRRVPVARILSPSPAAFSSAGSHRLPADEPRYTSVLVNDQSLEVSRGGDGREDTGRRIRKLRALGLV